MRVDGIEMLHVQMESDNNDYMQETKKNGLYSWIRHLLSFYTSRFRISGCRNTKQEYRTHQKIN
jgi:hypothetical protein